VGYEIILILKHWPETKTHWKVHQIGLLDVERLKYTWYGHEKPLVNWHFHMHISG